MAIWTRRDTFSRGNVSLSVGRAGRSVICDVVAGSRTRGGKTAEDDKKKNEYRLYFGITFFARAVGFISYQPKSYWPFWEAVIHFVFKSI